MGIGKNEFFSNTGEQRAGSPSKKGGSHLTHLQSLLLKYPIYCNVNTLFFKVCPKAVHFGNYFLERKTIRTPLLLESSRNKSY